MNSSGGESSDRNQDMSKSIQLGLARISSLLSALGNPHLAVPIIHVAGTNGKGSVCAYLDSILRQAGMRVGRFTSPHLTIVRDCISIQGKTIDSESYDTARRVVDECNASSRIDASSFEILTATAFEAFKRAKPPLDLAVVEVGMGGATDATNVCPSPLATVITAIDLDHQAFLGNTVAEIAAVKAGIIKEGVPCILAPQAHPEAAQTVASVAKTLSAPLYSVEPARRPSSQDKVQIPFLSTTIKASLSLAGDYQLANAATAAKTIELLAKSSKLPQDVRPEGVVTGLESTRWPGRLDWVTFAGRDILVDGAHNAASISALEAYLKSLPPQQTTFIVAVSSPRKPESLLSPLLQGADAQVLAVEFSPPEGMPWVKPVPAGEIVQAAQNMSVQTSQAVSLKKALESCSASDRIVICGSLYLVGDFYRLMEGHDQPS